MTKIKEKVTKRWFTKAKKSPFDIAKQEKHPFSLFFLTGKDEIEKKMSIFAL